MSPPHHRPTRQTRFAAGVRWLAEDSLQALRDWRPPERPEQDAPAPRSPRRRAPEPTWGRTPTAAALRRAVQAGGVFPLLNALGRPEVTGERHLRSQPPPLILAPNHASHADAPVVLQALPAHIRERTVVPAAADYFFDRRALSVFVTLAMNAVPFDRRNEIADSVRRCERFLRHGYSVVLFPEGTRSRDGRLRGFKAGVAHLAVQTGAAVVPVYVQGTHALLPRGAALPRPSAVTVHFGEPLHAGAEESARLFNHRLEQAVSALGAQAHGFAHHDSEPRRTPWLESWRASAGRGVDDRELAERRLTEPAATSRADAALPGGWIARWRSTTPR